MCKYSFSMVICFYFHFMVICFYFHFIFIIFMCKYLFNMGISFYIKFFTFFLYLSIFMCKYLFSMGISFYIKFFTFFLYLLFLCVSIWSGCVIVCVIKLDTFMTSRDRKELSPNFTGFFYWKCRILEISFYITFFTFILYLSFLCVSIYLVWEFPFSY